MAATAHKLTIESVRIVRAHDESPDLSYLGEYSNSADSPAAIDREERGDCGRGEYRWFNPAMTGEETGNPDSPEQDYQRFESYNAGHWSMIGIYASAKIVVDGTCQTIRSGGLWGIESDNDREYLSGIENEELAQLADTLRALGFSARAVKRALADVRRDD